MTAAMLLESCTEPLSYYGEPCEICDEGRGPYADRIDRARRLIRGVKISGLVSSNSGRIMGFDDDRPYRYAPEALADAVGLYEGVRVYCNHPKFEYDESGERNVQPGDRTIEDVFGRLVNVRYVAGEGLFGDLNYLATHPLAEQVLELAEWMPEQVALSHNAPRVLPVLEESGVVIRRIIEVRSVDIIGEHPGTTRSLFESAGRPATTKGSDPMTKNGTKAAAESDGALLPEEELVVEEGVEEVPADPAMQVRDGFKAAVNQVLGDDSLSVEAMKAKIGALLDGMGQANEAMAGGDEAAAVISEEEAAEAEGEEEEEAEAAEAEGEEEEEKAAAECKGIPAEKRLRAENALLRAGVKATAVQVAAVARCVTESGRKSLIESFRPKAQSAVKKAVTKSKPVVHTARTAAVAESGGATPKTLTREEVAQRLVGRRV